MSLFDDEHQNQKVVFKFEKPDQRHEGILHTPASISSNLICKDIATGAVKRGYYSLHGTLLASYASQWFESPDNVIDIAYARMKYIPSTSNAPANNVIVLTKNGYSFELVFAEKQIAENWCEVLKNVCIMTDFHEKYKALKLIGKGSFAMVYLAESKIDGEHYAVKGFSKDSLSKLSRSNEKAVIRNEINILRALDHDSIIQLIEVHETERSLYLVMELVQGKSLHEYLAKSTLRTEFTERQIAEIVFSILDAVIYIAAKGIMHRDLKPDNILIEKSGKIKIVDFGLATYIAVPEYIYNKCGTPGYIAPEVFKYDPKNPATAYDDRCDVFSVGCILFQILFGYLFFGGTSASEVLKSNREFTELHAALIIKKEKESLKSKINKDGLNLLQQMLEYNPKKRLTAAQAIDHCYFSVVPMSSQKLVSSRTMLEHKLSYGEPTSLHVIRNTSEEKGSSIKDDMLDKGSPLLKTRSKFVQKGSMFLDLNKPEINGKTDSIAFSKGDNLSSLNSLTNSITNSISNVSNFGRSGTLEPPKSAGKRKSFKTGQSILKAAIFNNMNKNNGDNGSETGKEDEIIGAKLERRNTESTIRDTLISYRTSKTCDFEDDDDDSQVSDELEEVEAKKLPKKMWQPGKKLSLSIQKEQSQ